MDSPGVGHGASDLFVFQARSFLDQISGIGKLPPCPSFRDGLRGPEIEEAIIASAHADGAAVKLA